MRHCNHAKSPTAPEMTASFICASSCCLYIIPIGLHRCPPYFTAYTTSSDGASSVSFKLSSSQCPLGRACITQRGRSLRLSSQELWFGQYARDHCPPPADLIRLADLPCLHSPPCLHLMYPILISIAFRCLEDVSVAS